jgi:predicted enzyme related to lactoylglutathione lyase
MANPSTQSGKVEVECVTPILRVSDLSTSLRFYVDVLGFSIDWGGDPGSGMASVSHSGHPLMLSEGDQGQPGTWIWIGVEDVDPLYAQCLAQGATIVSAPESFPWAYEFRVADPDGHVLRIGAEPRE